MKHRISLLWLALALAFVAGCSKKEEPAAAPPPPAEAPTAGAPKKAEPEKVTLKANYPVGKRLLQKTAMEMKMNIPTGQASPPIQGAFQISQDVAITVAGQREGGGYDLEAEFVAQKVFIQMPGQPKVDFDSSRDKAEDTKYPMSRELRKVIGLKLKLTTDASGQTTNVANYMEFAKKVTTGVSPQALALMRGFYAEPALRQMGLGRPSLPAGPVAVGESWPAKLPSTGMAQQMKMEMNYTLKGWEEREGRKCAVLEGSGSMSAPGAGPASPNGGMSIEFKGKSLFDMGYGLVVDETIEMGGGSPMDMKSTCQITEVADAKPAAKKE